MGERTPAKLATQKFGRSLTPPEQCTLVRLGTKRRLEALEAYATLAAQVI
jgi:hypothetical protein